MSGGDNRQPKIKVQDAKASETGRLALKLASLFGSTSGALVPVKPQTQATAKSATAMDPDKTHKIEPVTSASKLAPKEKTKVDREKTLAADVPVKSRAVLISKNPNVFSPLERVKDFPKTSKTRMITIVAVSALAVIAILSSIPYSMSHSRRQLSVQARRAAEKEQVDYYRKTTGWKLNNERVETELENNTTAPALRVDLPKVKVPSPMLGLPLEGERAVSLRSKYTETRPMNPSAPDANVGYILQEEQAANDWEKRAQEQYIQDLKENALNAGVKLNIDEYGNVTVDPSSPVGGRKPGSAGGR